MFVFQYILYIANIFARNSVSLLCRPLFFVIVFFQDEIISFRFLSTFLFFAATPSLKRCILSFSQGFIPHLHPFPLCLHFFLPFSLSCLSSSRPPLIFPLNCSISFCLSSPRLFSSIPFQFPLICHTFHAKSQSHHSLSMNSFQMPLISPLQHLEYMYFPPC